MSSYVYWRSMDRDIKSLVKSWKGSVLAAKAPPIKFIPWQKKNNRLWSILHTDFAGPFNGSYYLIVEDSFSKWPEILWCKKPHRRVINGCLHEMFERFGLPHSIVSVNAIQETSKYSEDFCWWWKLSLATLEATVKQIGSRRL